MGRVVKQQTYGLYEDQLVKIRANALHRGTSQNAILRELIDSLPDIEVLTIVKTESEERQHATTE